MLPSPIRIDICRNTPQCQAFRERLSAEGGQVTFVEVEAYKAGKTYRFAGCGSDVEYADDDAREHAFDYLGDDARVGDWYAL
jgi:hypothetical protein